MWNGKNKAVTFSFDDGVIQDIKLINVLDKYGLKATFNLNSALLGREHKVDEKGAILERGKVKPEQVKQLYANHEVGGHTLRHPDLVVMSEDEIATEVNQDVKALEKLTGKPVKVFAFPFGRTDERVRKVLANRTQIKLARTVNKADNFDIQEDLLTFKPTVHFAKIDELFKTGQDFIDLKPENPQVLYIWGHAYELDDRIPWETFEEFCKLISNKEDIFYGTNSEVFKL